jgi:hypothetical protein
VTPAGGATTVLQFTNVHREVAAIFLLTSPSLETVVINSIRDAMFVFAHPQSDDDTLLGTVESDATAKLGSHQLLRLPETILFVLTDDGDRRSGPQLVGFYLGRCLHGLQLGAVPSL